MKLPPLVKILTRSKIGLIILAVLTLILLSGIMLVKLNTAAAAQLTDNVLRPLLGANNVIRLEKIFFNASDKADQAKYAFKQPDSPLIVQPTPSPLPTPSISPSAVPSLNLNPLQPSHFTPLPGEGIWTNKPLVLFPNETVMAYTFVRPDSERDYSFTTVIQVDMTKFRLGTVAGKKEPGGPIGNIGPGVIPQDIIDSGNLAAAFDGGFQYRDGQYGMIVDGKTYVPLKPNLGTLFGYTDGSLKIIDYTNQPIPDNVAFIRQNAPILLKDGDVTPLDPKIKSLWGRTLTSSIYTWRSGIGLTPNGNLIYAVGNNLTPTTLAQALKMAGAANAIQLDINPYWVRFNIFNKTDQPGIYESSVLTKGIQDGSKQYLHGYEKDFFYLYKK